jgi:hypothetical protein
MDHRDSWRQMIRRELRLAPRCRRSATLVRVASATALLWALGSSAAEAQAPYRQELIPGFSTLLAGRGRPALVDLDGDGDLDVVVGGLDFGGSLRYFENTGNTSTPAFAEATGTANPFASIDVGYQSSPDLVDLDGDGDLDAVVGDTRDGSLRYFENTGDASTPAFAEATGTANPVAGIVVSISSSPELVDLDGDGDFDAVVGDSGGLLRYFENTGGTSTPAFAEATGTANPFAGIDVDFHSRPDLVDLDGDGDLDAVVGEAFGSLRYFENTGDASTPAFAEATGTANPFAGINVDDFSSPDLVDLDGDGDLDAVVGQSNTTLRYFENTGGTSSPAFAEATGTAAPFIGIDVGFRSSPDLVDLDGDGDLDAVIGESSYGSLRYFENTGGTSSPAFAEATGTANPFAGIYVGSYSSPDLVDLDGDGDLDAVVGERFGSLRYFENTGDTSSPAFAEATGTANPFAGIDVVYNSSPDLIDLDGDGDFDAVVGNLYGSLRYFENTGDTSSSAFVEATGAANPFAGIDVGLRSSPDLVDLDGDGDFDAVVGEFFGSLRYFENTGDTNSPAFAEATGTANPFAGIDIGYNSSPDFVDLDGDGDLDAVVGEYAGRVVFFRSLAFDIFADGFESGDRSAWSSTVPP